MEVRDILILRSRNQALELDDSEYSVSTRLASDLRADFIKGTPFGYLLGLSEFYGRQYYLNEHVLIPRSETELLVDHLVHRCKGPLESVLDVGVGSGVILLSLLAQNVAKKGVGVDLSEEALKVAATNARRLRVDSRVQFLLSDRLNEVHESFDLIVSNPPYIKTHFHKKLVHQKVDEFEPSLALYINDEEYASWFQTFFQQILQALKPGGLFMMEGHELELVEQARVLKELGFQDVEVLQDYAGLNRFICTKSAL
jgi:release factor glutamine methyltransferase